MRLAAARWKVQKDYGPDPVRLDRDGPERAPGFHGYLSRIPDGSRR